MQSTTTDARRVGRLTDVGLLRALALASAEVHDGTVEPGGRKRDFFYDGLSDPSAFGPAPALDSQGFLHRLDGRKFRIQRRDSVLENHLDIHSKGEQFPMAELCDISARKPDLAGVRLLQACYAPGHG